MMTKVLRVSKNFQFLDPESVPVILVWSDGRRIAIYIRGICPNIVGV